MVTEGGLQTASGVLQAASHRAAGAVSRPEPRRPRQPVYAVGLVSLEGVPFVLVREAAGQDHIGVMIA